MDSAFCQDLGKTAVAELGSGSYGPEPFSLAYVSPGKRGGSSIGLSSQELHFHLRVLNMNKKPIEYLKWLSYIWMEFSDFSRTLLVLILISSS